MAIADVCAALAVKHGVVYQDCDASGHWVTVKNTSECDLTDSTPVRNVFLFVLLLLHCNMIITRLLQILVFFF